jgi:hypothetical protein
MDGDFHLVKTPDALEHSLGGGLKSTSVRMQGDLSCEDRGLQEIMNKGHNADASCCQKAFAIAVMNNYTYIQQRGWA